MSSAVVSDRLSGLVVALGTAAMLAAAPAFPALGAATTPLASHRAVYDLSLASKDTSSSVSSVRGRMVHEFMGSSCEGYAVNMRWVAVMGGDGDDNVDDVRFASWEDGEGASYSYTSTRYLNDKLVEEVKAHAERGDGQRTGRVELAKPTEESIDLPPSTVFPTAHLLNVIEAAKAGQTFAEETVYDVSEDGQQIYKTLAVLGARRDGDKGLKGVNGAEPLKSMPAWRVTISYFKGSDGGEETPAFEQTFDLFANGVASDLLLDYGEIVIKGTLTDLKFLSVADCTP